MSRDLEQENEELRHQLESYRQREISELQERLSVAVAEADHFRSEAHRNAELGRQIASEAQATIADLRAKLSVYEKLETSGVRRGTATRTS